MPGGANVVCVAGTERATVERALDFDVTVRVAESLSAVRESVTTATVDCVLAGSDLPDRSTTDVLLTVREIDARIPVVLWPDDVDQEESSRAVRHDASEYLPGADVETVAERVELALEDTSPVPGDGSNPFADNLPDAAFVFDESGSIVYASEATRDVFGYPPTELEGGRLDQIIPGGLRDEHDEAITEFVETGGAPLDLDAVEVTTVDDAGNEFAVTLSLGEFVLGGDRFVGCTVRDVADRKRRERALTNLNESTRKLMDAQDDDTVAEIAVDTAKDVLGMPINTVFRSDESADRLQPVAWTTETEDFLGDPPSLGLDDSLAGEAYTSGDPAIYADLSAEPERHNPETPLRSEMLLPLGDHGVLVVGDTDVGAYDDVDASLARIFAANVEAAFTRAEREQTLWQFRAAIESVQDLLFAMDDDGRFALVTDPLADLLGYERSDLVGSSIETVFTRAGIEEGVVLVNHLLAGMTDSRVSYETALEPSDGDPIPVEIELSVMDGGHTVDGVVGVVRDRSEIEQAREELATARERFTDLFEHIPDAVVDVEFVDGDPIVRATNPAFEEVFGYSSDEVVGSSLNEYVLTRNERRSGDAIDRQAMAGSLTKVRVRRKTANGLRDFLFRGIPYDTDGESVRGFGIYTDITDQAERERRLGVLTNVLRHNLRTEMNLVLAHTDRIIESEPREDVATLVEKLRGSAEAVVELGEAAHDLEELIERTWGTDGSVDLVVLVGSVADELSTRYPSTTIETDLPDSAAVLGEEALRRALFELVENAVVHADGVSSVEVVVEPVDDEWIELRIADHGPGIPAFERELLAGDREVTQLQHGSGFGLWIAQWTVESLGGSLTLLDREPTGTVARVRLRRD